MSKESKATVEDRVLWLKTVIGCAAMKAGLNITVYDGKIGFVDQEERKIVALWKPEYKLTNDGGDNDGTHAPSLRLIGGHQE